MSAAGSALKLRRKKNVKKGIQFCLMVCGASGTGRTTFVNTLCGKTVLEGQDNDDPTTAHIEEGVKIKPVTVELELDEEGTRVSLTIVDTPVIGKADSLTPLELAESKKLIMEDIEHYRIPVYNFPYDIEEDDEDTVEENAELRGLMPFAIVGSDETIELEGRTVRARQYPWGIVEVDNPRHSDFLAIRSALLHSHLADLKEITHDFLYENYRTEKLSKSVNDATSAGDNSESLDPQSLASQSVRLKEEQLRREEEKLREIEIKVQREIEQKRQELLARESQLKELESRMNREPSTMLDDDHETQAGA